MDAVNNNISSNEQDLCAHLNNRHIISNPLNQGGIRGIYPFSDSMDESELTDPPKIHLVRFQLRTLVRDGFKPFPTERLTFFLARAIFKTSSICLTGIKSIFFRMYGGRSARSFLFRYGMITTLILFRRAARAFSFKPPTGRTLPLSVISPVLAPYR